tara:strand:- start:189 stop:434 length:246 start_codon:yes stop_codon:yes gene_type:complete
MAMDLIEIKKLIKESLPDAIVEIQDLAGDGNHYSATITSSIFNGKSRIEQHKIVYAALKGKMGNELHALAIKTKEKNGTEN